MNFYYKNKDVLTCIYNRLYLLFARNNEKSIVE